MNRFASFCTRSSKGGGGATWNGTGNKWYLSRDVAFNQCYEDTTGCAQQQNFVGLHFEQADNGHHPSYGFRIALGPTPGQIQRIRSVLID